MTLALGTLKVALTPSAEGLEVSITPPPALPVGALTRGRPPEEAARLMGLIFNACAEAQAMAVRSAFGLPSTPEAAAKIRHECLRDHVVNIADTWPRLFGIEGDKDALVRAASGEGLAERLFGDRGALPSSWAGFETWARSAGTVASEIVSRVLRDWPVAWGQADLPILDLETAVDWPAPTQGGGAVENSPVCRLTASPLLEDVRARFGPGLLWRMATRLVDVERILGGDDQSLAAVGAAPAARGVMLVRGTRMEERIDTFERLSPTDFAMAPGGVLERALATLSDGARGTIDLESAARVVLAIIDPCYPTDLRVQAELPAEEPCHA